MVIGSDGGLSTLSHSCGYFYQQRKIKTFHSPAYLRSEDENMAFLAKFGHIYIYIYIYTYIYIYIYT